MSLDETATALLRKALELKSVSVLGPITKQLLESLKDTPDAKKVDAGRNLVLTVADPISRALSSGTLPEDDQRLVAAITPALY